MTELKPFTAYEISRQGFSIYIYSLSKDFVAIKYGEDDLVAHRGTYTLGNNLLKERGLRETNFSLKAFDDIRQYVIQNIFEDEVFRGHIKND